MFSAWFLAQVHLSPNLEWHTGRVTRIYHGDHTAHLRQQLKDRALHFGAGTVVAVCAAIANWFIVSHLDGHNRLVAALWGLNIALGLIAVLGLCLTALLYLIYRLRRPELDAASAEAVGEARARVHRERAGGPS
ncbi:hypothetical protein GCM10010109_65500 [Actinoplanes campanulatus]|nr:hypothetical protein GCM10010109_65500 [Actinoplanes campanulatus]GID39604.1 hypothetical protein Aca09nite_61100 [Actinoplanes campanulatus]